jgi:copper transport protein
MRLIAGAAALLLAMGVATEAAAHAALVVVEPRDGSVLAEVPKAIELRFNENVTAGAVNLMGPDGKVRTDATVEAEGDAIKVAPPKDLPDGTSIISYRVISQDGHPVAGSVTFSIGTPTATKPPEDLETGISGLIWLSRVGLYVGLFAGIGGVFFGKWICNANVAAKVIVASLVVGLVCAAVSIGLQGLDVLGLPLSGIATAVPWRVALGTSLGPSLLSAIAAMLAGLIAWRSTSARLARALSAIALAGVGLSLAASGHAATAPPQALTRPAMFLHGAGVAFWLGAFAPMLAILWSPRGVVLPILNRFSTVAVPVVGVLALTGLALAAVQLESIRALIETKYGVILSIKLMLVAVLLGLATLNRFRLMPALARDVTDTRPLVRSILLEGILGLVILCVVAGWRFTPPPRTLIPDAPLAVHIHTDKAMFQVLISPGKIGSDSFVLQLMNDDGSLLQAKEATLTVSSPEHGIEAIERPASRGPDGYWHVTNVPLPAAGRWHLRIDALVTDFQMVTLEDDFDIATR